MMKKKNNNKVYALDENQDYAAAFVHLARLALQQKHADVAAIARQHLGAIRKHRTELATQIDSALRLVDASPLRRQVQDPIPVDAESRFELLRVEQSVELAVEPVWPKPVREFLAGLVKERQKTSELLSLGVSPTRSMLFTGLPGVGKTLAARWIARETGRPLMVLDLTSVMNSFLGKTGANLRTVMEHAKRVPSVLLLDEVDALAKRRDDTTDVGELKRLVTVLIQELDSWPSDGILIAATNHPELLDPAIWRRFEATLTFPPPSTGEVDALLAARLGSKLPADTRNAVSQCFAGASFADIEALAKAALRASVVNDMDVGEAILALSARKIGTLSQSQKVAIASHLAKSGWSQRQISDLTGLARDTLRKFGSHAKTAVRRKR